MRDEILKRTSIVLTLTLCGGLGAARMPAAAASERLPEAGEAPLLPPLPVSDPSEAPDPEEAGRLTFPRSSGWLGVQIADLTDERAAELSLPEVHGALVSKVDEDSPAARAGIKQNDVIVTFQGQRVESAAALRRMVRETPPDRTVRVGVNRAGTAHTFEVALEKRRFGPARLLGHELDLPDIEPFDTPHVQALFIGRTPRLGVSVHTLTPQLASYFGVRAGEGVLVTEVHPGTPADAAGLKAGDVIVRLDEEEIADTDDLHQALRDKEGRAVTLKVVRDRGEMTLQAKPERGRPRTRADR